jgi:gas vesicle protein
MKEGVTQMPENRDGNATSILLAFLAGGLMGFGLGLLLAPLSGRETRERIRGASHEVKELTIETADRAREKVEGLVEHGKEVAADAKERVRTTLESGKDAFHQTKTELADKISSDSSEEA